MNEKIYIKHMVCPRCIKAVDEVFRAKGIFPVSVELGLVQIEKGDLMKDALEEIRDKLSRDGFELIDDKKSLLLEQVKTKVIDTIHHSGKIDLQINWSSFLADVLDTDYNTISHLFSAVEGITLEHYIILQKIEKVKELIFYDELSIKEISFRLGYSSVAHLSSQFKKVTGFTPTQFKKSIRSKVSRKPINDIR